MDDNRKRSAFCMGSSDPEAKPAKNPASAFSVYRKEEAKPVKGFANFLPIGWKEETKPTNGFASVLPEETKPANGFESVLPEETKPANGFGRVLPEETKPTNGFASVVLPEETKPFKDIASGITVTCKAEVKPGKDLASALAVICKTEEPDDGYIPDDTDELAASIKHPLFKETVNEYFKSNLKACKYLTDMEMPRYNGYGRSCYNQIAALCARDPPPTDQEIKNVIYNIQKEACQVTATNRLASIKFLDDLIVHDVVPPQNQHHIINARCALASVVMDLKKKHDISLRMLKGEETAEDIAIMANYDQCDPDCECINAPKNVPRKR